MPKSRDLPPLPEFPPCAYAPFYCEKRNQPCPLKPLQLGDDIEWVKDWALGCLYLGEPITKADRERFFIVKLKGE